MLLVGRPRKTHKDLPKGFRLVAGRWYWRPTDAATRMVLQRLPAKSPSFGDKPSARLWWVKTVLPLLDPIAPEDPASHGTFSELIQLYRSNGMAKKGGELPRARTAAEYEKHLKALDCRVRG